MTIEALNLRKGQMRLKHPFQASLGITLDTRVLLVELHSDRLVGRGEVVFPECAYAPAARRLAMLRQSEEEDRADHRWYWEPSSDRGLR